MFGSFKSLNQFSCSKVQACQSDLDYIQILALCGSVCAYDTHASRSTYLFRHVTLYRCSCQCWCQYDWTWLIILCVVLFVLLIPILVAILICLYMFRYIGVPVSVDAQYDWTWLIILLFDLILYVPSTIFQLYRDGYSWVEPVLS